MKKGINLLSHVEIKSESQVQYKKLLTIISTVSLLITAIIVFVLLLIQLFFKNEVQKINTENQSLEKQITENRDVEATLRALKLKISLLQTIQSQPSYATTLIKFLDENTPEGIIYSQIAIPDNSKFTFSGNAANAISFGSLMQNLLDEDKGKKLFTSLRLDSFSSGKIGDYSFNFTAVVAQNL